MFRRSRKSKTSKSNAGSKSTPRKPINWPALRQTATVMGWLIVLAGAAVGWIYGVPRLHAYASVLATPAALPQQGAGVRVEFVDLPRWVTPELETRLTLTAQQHITGDPLAQHELAQARESLLSTGWFEDIGQLRRASSDVVEVQARLVDPFALIRDKAGDHLVDRLGKLLPQSFQRGSKTSIPVIIGARFSRPGRPLLAWEGEDVSSALRVLRLIEDRPWRDQVVAVDASDYLARSNECLKLITNRGSWIVWGRAPGDERAAEVSAAQKLDYLDYHFRQYGHIDKNHAREVDIRLDRVLLR